MQSLGPAPNVPYHDRCWQGLVPDILEGLLRFPHPPTSCSLGGKGSNHLSGLQTLPSPHVESSLLEQTNDIMMVFDKTI